MKYDLNRQNMTCTPRILSPDTTQEKKKTGSPPLDHWPLWLCWGRPPVVFSIGATWGAPIVSWIHMMVTPEKTSHLYSWGPRVPGLRQDLMAPNWGTKWESWLMPQNSSTCPRSHEFASTKYDSRWFTPKKSSSLYCGVTQKKVAE